MDAENFALAIEAARIVESERGIGTLTEGLIHSAIKYYYQPDPRLHEMKVNGCVCDAIAERHGLGRTVIEVQTSNLGYLTHKLERYFAATDNGESAECVCKTEGACIKKTLTEIALSGKEAEFPGRVTVIYPMDSANQIIRVDTKTGETKVGPRRKNLFIPAHALWELYSLREYIGRDGFTLILLGVETRDTRESRGVKRGRQRYERTARIPIALTHELVLKQKSDYYALLPEGLPERFTAKEFSLATRLTDRTAGAGLHLFMKIGLLEREKEGRIYRYYKTKGVDL